MVRAYDGDYDDEPEYHEPRSLMIITAWTQDEGRIEAHCWTNDNGDTGYPGETADWTLRFRTLDAFKKHAGLTRQGSSMDTLVKLDGVEMRTEQDYLNAAAPIETIEPTDDWVPPGWDREANDWKSLVDPDA